MGRAVLALHPPKLCASTTLKLPFCSRSPALPAVDLMEEVISDGEGEGSGKPGSGKKGHKGQKRKKQQEAPA